MPWWICFLQTCSFSLHKMLTDGLEWCGLLWCFYQLFGLLFWRHPFTADDPLLSKWWSDEFLQIDSHEETNSFTSWMAWGRVHLQKVFIIDCSQRAWLIGDLINHNAESAILPDKQIRQESRLTSVDLNFKNCVYCRLSTVEIKYVLIFIHVYFMLLSKYEKMIGSCAAWTEVLQWSVTTH